MATRMPLVRVLVALLQITSLLKLVLTKSDALDTSIQLSDDRLTFTRASYNVSIPENCVGKTYARPQERMGIQAAPEMSVRYKIVSGDKDKHFKAEAKQVGDFWYLLLRIRTENSAVLNREYQEKYKIKIKASLHQKNRKLYDVHCDVIVTIIDKNDISPLFYPRTYNVTISEMTPLHQSVLKVNADDPDRGINGEIYYSLAEPSRQFSIHPTLGTLSVTRPLDFQQKSIYNLSVVARDRGPKLGTDTVIKASTAKVTIFVTPANRHKPKISVKNLQSYIEHGVGPETWAVVQVTDEDQGLNGQIGGLAITDGDLEGQFRVHSTAPGEYNVDFDPRNGNAAQSRDYNLTLRAWDRGSSSLYSDHSVYIKVSPSVGSISPVFNKEDYDVQIEEVAPPNSPLVKVVASLPHEEKHNNVIVYRIETGDEEGVFSINTKTGLISTNKWLDRESRRYYSLTISATNTKNRSSRHRTSAVMVTTIVNINVLDCNDNAPRFNSSIPSVVTIDENLSIGSKVLTVSAADADDEENGYVTFALANTNRVPFKINPFTGAVTTTDIIDYESMSTNFYLLRIRATDWGTPFQRQTEMSVRVQVRDLNDHRPQFEKVDCAVSINTQTPLGTGILTLSAIDLDMSSYVTYRMEPSSEHQCFSLDTSTGVLSVACDDLNDLGDVTLNISATDGEHFADTMHVKIKINKFGDTRNRLLKSRKADKPHVECREAGITQGLGEHLAGVQSIERNSEQTEDTLISHSFFENRFAPEFSKSVVEISVNESLSVGSNMARLRAKDADHGYNGRLVYVISSGDEDSCFKMDLYKGNLILVEPLDRERTPKYILNVTAFDLGEPKKSAWMTVIVYVLDVNDNTPVFEKSFYKFRFSEAVTKGALVAKLRASDADDGENSRLRYKLTSDTVDFIVEEKSGILIVQNGLDRERQAEYNLMVKATDSSHDMPLTGTTMVQIQVQDVNDEPPRFTLKNYLTRVREDLPQGTVIMTMSAQDPDLDDGGKVSYQMMSKDLKNMFDVDPETGIVRLIGELDFEQKQMYNVSIRASDSGEPTPLYSDGFLIVEVEDVNENRHAPKFHDIVVQASVDENLPAGAYVTNVTATDDDDSTKLDGMVTYSIIDGDGVGLFSIDDKGVITTRSVLDCENKPYYWLVVSAHDRAAVPLSSRLDVYVQVNDVNDNIPLTKLPYYKATVLEDSPGHVSVLDLEAFDGDYTSTSENITFQITAGDPQGFFRINHITGLVTTTERKLDREAQDRYLMDVTVTDGGNPPLTSVTQVLIQVGDINDHDPKFSQTQYRFKVLEQEDLPEQDDLCQVSATDADTGANSELHYSILQGAGYRFSIDQHTGMIRSRSALLPNEMHELVVKVSDLGEVSRHSTSVVVMAIQAKPTSTANHPPKIKSVDVSEVLETDKVGHVVAMVSAVDKDLDPIFYKITSGNEKSLFALRKPDEGLVFVARAIVQSDVGTYALGLEATDGLGKTYTEFNVTVMDDNNQFPEFIEEKYSVEVSEQIKPGTDIIKIKAVDKDLNDQLYYAIHNAAALASLKKFHLSSTTGSLQVSQALDHEETKEHVITALAGDSGLPGKRAYVRIHILVADHNDHAPEFLQSSFEGKVFESAAVGTSVIQASAIDKDRGDNARISYSIISGNVGGSFGIQPQLGIVTVAKSLNQQVLPEYYLVVRASDHGSPPLNTTATVHVKVTMATNAPPKFDADTKVIEVLENQPIGTPVIVVQAQSGSALYYDISLGNDDGCFTVDQSSGIVSTGCVLDYESRQQYLIIVRATNLVNSVAEIALTIHVVDTNDNPPLLNPTSYIGYISEASDPSSVVMTNNSLPLVVTATDADRDINAHLSFTIVDSWARRFFRIDSSTGSISSSHKLDREIRDFYSFNVEVCDNGRPTVMCSRGPAKVMVHVLDVNDSPAIFEKDYYNASLVLPTHKGVTVARVEAHDADLNPVIVYSILAGNSEDHFTIDPVSGLVKVNHPEDLIEYYRLIISANDGVHEKTTVLHVNVAQSPSMGNPSFRFSYSLYTTRVVENIHSTEGPLLVLTTVGTPLQEHIHFKLLNEEDKFIIGETSGALTIKPGVLFDREQQPSYRLVVNAFAMASDRVASTLVDVTIEDVNDNPPTFVDTPYHCVVPVESLKGEEVQKVRAEDPDEGDNGVVLYYLRDDQKGVFDINTKTGHITLRKRLPSHISQYTLTVVAKDAGTPALYSEVQVPIKVVTRTMPSFEKQFYTSTVKEDHSPNVPVLTLQAQSPRSRPLIYDIVGGNHIEDFRLDYQAGPSTSNTPCILYVNEELNFDQVSKYDLTVRATDSITGAHADVSVRVLVEDINNHPPMFEQVLYNATVSELSPPGSTVTRVRAIDKDSNSVITYSVEDTDRFNIDPRTGVITLRKSIDYEKQSKLTLTVTATDSGAPHPLTSTALVFIQVVDTNDSPPVFDRPQVECAISELARRGQFVAHLGASDPDFSPNILSPKHLQHKFPLEKYSNTPSLAYQIISGSPAFSVDRYTGVISVGNLHHFKTAVQSDLDVHLLNVSVTDGVFVSFCRVKIYIVPANNHSPKFTHTEYEAIVLENSPPDTYVTTVSATDQDRGIFGRPRYYIQSEESKLHFSIDQDSGEVRTKKPLDREKKSLYKIAVVAEDGGGKIGHTIVRVTITDMNDNAPQFLLAEYRANVKNHSIGLTIAKVTAIDRDQGLYSTMKYSIHEGNPRNVSDSFGIVEDSGEIYIKAILREGTHYQFFAKASDKGIPSLESVVPVTIVALSPSQVEPYTKARLQDLYVKENSKIPTIIATLNTVSSNDIKFSIIPNDNDISLFTIDSDSGRLTAIRSLDREECSTYYVGVRAESRSSGLISLIQINVHVMDDNDNKPQFESAPKGYTVRIAENVPIGSRVIGLIATDADIDSNGMITYDFYERNDPAADIFQIDGQTGWVTTLIALDRESVPTYNLSVVARDNGSPLKLYSLTSVNIIVVDYNDNPPHFSASSYDTQIAEDTQVGVGIMTLKVEDPDDPRSQTMYFYLTSGNDRNHFGLTESGDLFVREPLDRETQEQYVLEVTASDGIYLTKTKVNIMVLDANDNGPVCIQSKYIESIKEDLAVGSYILTVSATDADMGANAMMRFSLSGKGHEHFHINSSSGELYVIQGLDRETQSSYTLTAHVQDSQQLEWQCTSTVLLLVSDINDCAPQFTKDNYTVAIAEDAEIGTVLMKIQANDRDLGMNRKVSYALVESANGYFDIRTSTGIIQLTKTLDREKVDTYRLIVEAVDHGTPELSAAVQVIVIVLDVNDNPPEFTQKFYQANISEMAPHGTPVAHVKAFSRDIGINAEISYSLEQIYHNFDIDHETGVISVMRTLDFETQSQFVLTVVAKDGGTPTLSATTLVNISVVDFNDNKPLFDKARYNSVIREDTKVGEKILQIQASDADTGPNGEIFYNIVNSSDYKEFEIDSGSGVVVLRRNLDRELQSDYYFSVMAKDNGVPQLNETVEVSVTLSDINDNAPQFVKGGNYSAIVQEAKRHHPVIDILVTDRDTPANAGPFTLTILNGNFNSDFVVRGMTVLTNNALSTEKRAQYNLEIQVSDSGTPSLSSKTNLHIKVIEESKFPPEVDDLHVYVTSYQDDFPGGNIGKVHANDMDPYDKLSYDLVDKDNSLFTIDREEGTLSAQNGLDVGSYIVNVSVTDAKFYTHAQAFVDVNLVTEDALSNAVILTLSDVTPEDFLLTYQKGFQNGLKLIFNLKKQNVHIISIQPSITVNSSNAIEKRAIIKRSSHRDNLDVLFAVRKNQQYYTADFISKKLKENLATMEKAVNVKVLHISQNRCQPGMCTNGICSDTVVLDRSVLQSITTDRLSFVSPQHYAALECICQPGYGGPKCQTPVNECHRNPCKAPKICIPSTLQATGYTCQCPENTGGVFCNITCGESTNQETCYIERHPLNFDERSYAQYELLHGIDKRLMFSGRIRTFQQSGVILYASGSRDYSILEVAHGKVQFRFDCGSGEGLVRVSHKTITDGKWHHVILERRGNFARVSVDRKWEASGVSPGSHDILDLDLRNSFFIGASLVGYHRDEIRRGFVGCMDDIRVNSVSLPLHVTGTSNVAQLKRFVNVQFLCRDPLTNPGACGTQPCYNGATCLRGFNSNFTCVCNEPRFKGRLCEVDTDPCASNPCLFGTLCRNVYDGVNNDFHCECPPQLSGKRCEYGQYCNPNPCENSGVCEEGEIGYTCRCPIGYRGDKCQHDIDECLHPICAYGATCINLLGGFQCVCPPNVTGPFCNEHLATTSIISSRLNTTVEELVGIASVVLTVFMLALCTVCFFRQQFKKHRRLQSQVLLHGTTNTGDPLEFCVGTNNKKKKKHKQQTAEQCQMADLLLDIAGKKLDGGSMMNNLDKQPMIGVNNMQSTNLGVDASSMAAPTTPQSILRISHAPDMSPYIDKDQMYSEDKIKNCSLACAAMQPPGLRYDDIQGYSWDYSDLTADQRPLTSNIPEHVPAINDEVNSLLSSTESNSNSNLTALGLPPITPPLPSGLSDLSFTTSSPVQLGFEDQSVLYNRDLNDYLPSHQLSRDTSINSESDMFVSYGFPQTGGKGFILSSVGNPTLAISDGGSSTSDDNTDNTVVRKVNV